MAVDEDGIDSEIDLYDTDRIAIAKVYQAISENIGQHREMGAFQREVRERFAEIGFVVRVDLYHDMAEDHLPDEERTWYPKISFTERCEPIKVGEFDHERQGHEVRSNVLGVAGQDNVQKTQVAGGFGQTKSGIFFPKS